MNPIEIYKKLPCSNCGECTAGTCMAFAIRVSKGDQSPSECPGLDDQVRKEINSMLSDTGDWKEKRLAELFKEISEIDFASIAGGIGARVHGVLLKLKYMDREVTVSHSDITEELGIWDKLLVLMYIKNRGMASLSGKWVAFRDLKDGFIRSAGFQESCESSLAKIFDKSRENFLIRLDALGARKLAGFSTKYSFVLYPLPMIPFLVLLWPGEEDFRPECKVLLDSTATEFLDVEALLYLGMALLRAFKA